MNSPTLRSLTNCYFLNSETGWISGDSGTIMQTSDGGINWNIQNSGTFNNIEDIFFLNERLGWALAYEVFPDSTEFHGTLILETTDGGNNWGSSMFQDTNMFMKSVYFVDSLKGFLGGIGSSIVLTTNGGITWTYTDTDSSLFFILPVFKIKFFDENIGYACGGFRDIAGVTWVTYNGGLNWTGTILAPEPFFDIAVLDNQKTICAGGDLEYGSSIAITTNQGANWYYDTLGVFGLATGIDNRTEYEIWMTSSYAAKFIYSVDTGQSWTVIETPGNSAIFDLDFTDSVNGYACGANGVILKYDRTVSNVFNGLNEIPGPGFTLYQNYPNPFNPKTNISYKVSMFGNIELKVYDVRGNEVAVLINENQKPGDYNIEFNAVNLSSGIYFYRLTSGQNSSTRKMTILK